MHVSNAILVLKEILPVFPLGVINSGTGFFLDEALQTLLSTEKRGDIKILATSYQGQLRMARKDWEVASEQAGISSEVDSCFSSYSVTHICV
jgi:THO complex subunit 2